MLKTGFIKSALLIVLAALFVFSGCSAAPHTPVKAADPVMNTILTTSGTSTTTATTPVVSPPGIPPFDQTNWKMTEVQAIATASQYLPANVVSQATIEANMEEAGNFTTGETNYYWDVDSKEQPTAQQALQYAFLTETKCDSHPHSPSHLSCLL